MDQAAIADLNNQLAEQLSEIEPVILLADDNILPEAKIILAAIKMQEEHINASIPKDEPIVLHNEVQKLGHGWVKGSEVEGVNDIKALKTMIGKAAKLIDKTEMADGTTSYRFEVPPGYTAKTCWARVAELGQRKLIFRPKSGTKMRTKHPQFDCMVVLGYRLGESKSSGEDEAFFYAPNLGPIPTNVLTFVVNTKDGRLIKWFPGEDKSRFKPTSDLKTHWVNCCYQPQKQKQKPVEDKKYYRADRDTQLTPKPIATGTVPSIMTQVPKKAEEPEDDVPWTDNTPFTKALQMELADEMAALQIHK